MAEQRNYPPPQVEVAAARDVMPPIEQVSVAPSRGGEPIEVDFSDVHEGGKSGFSLGGAIHAIWSQAIMPALEKLIPQGAAEIAQGLFTGQAYVPYGPTEAAVPIEPGSVFGSHEPAPAVEAAPAQESSGYQVFTPEAADPVHFTFEQMMADAASNAKFVQQNNNEIER